MCWARGRHNLEHWSQCDTIATPETLTLVALRHHCDTIATPETMTLVALRHHCDTFAIPRIRLVAVVSQYAKLVCNYWNVGRTATKQNKVELLDPRAHFWWAWARETGLRCCWVARRALDARDSHNAMPPGYFVSALATFASSPCHEAHFTVVK